MAASPISCAQHDYIEIACLHRYQVRIHLKDGTCVTGRALDTQTTSEKREYLIIEMDGKEPIEMNQIKKIEILSPNALFKEIRL